MGKIKNLRRQVKIELIPKTPRNGARYYIADFVYTDTATGKEIFEDVKSEITAKDKVYKLKKGMVALNNKVDDLVEQLNYSNRYICFEEDCSKRRPPIGTYKPKCVKK